VRTTLPNPFRQRSVNDLWQSLETDLPALYQQSLIRFDEAFDKLRAQHNGLTLLLHGEAGAGKSHLLARFRADITELNYTSDFTEAEGVTFVAVNLQKTPAFNWRYLQQCLATDLLRSTTS